MNDQTDRTVADTAGARRTGGCQCGAVRYAVTGPLLGADLCHCRMCQRAVGGPFFACFFVRPAQLTWTRGTPKTYRSSNLAERGFCGDCGSPLFFRFFDGKVISPAIASLDKPDDVVPVHQVCVESRVAWIGTVAGLPERPPGGQAPVESRQFDPCG